MKCNTFSARAMVPQETVVSSRPPHLHSDEPRTESSLSIPLFSNAQLPPHADGEVPLRIASAVEARKHEAAARSGMHRTSAIAAMAVFLWLCTGTIACDPPHRSACAHDECTCVPPTHRL